LLWLSTCLFARIESTLLPLVSSKFRVDLSRSSLGILGSSLGGLISCYAGWTRAKVYGKVGCMSSSFWWDDNNFQNHILTEQDIDRSQSLPVFYMDSGTSGGEASCAMYTAQVDDIMQQKGFVADQTVFKYLDPGAAHNEASWGARFSVPIQDLYPPTTV
jgi:predicted alpha/beta superfamily hydrolase